MQKNIISSQVHMEHFPGGPHVDGLSKSNLSKFKKTEIITSIFSDHNAETRYQLQEKNFKDKNT